MLCNLWVSLDKVKGAEGSSDLLLWGFRLEACSRILLDLFGESHHKACQDLGA